MAQRTEATIRKGNRAYKKNDFDQSQAEYRKALSLSPSNGDAEYNLGNALFRKNSYEDAIKSYDAAIQTNADKFLRAQSFYNKGVAYQKQQKLEESIDAWKNALKLDPDDAQARDNLAKALQEKKQQDQQKKDDENKKKPDPQNKQDKTKDKQEPKQPQSKLSKQQVEQLLKALAQKEQEVQDKMNQNKAKSVTQQDKDW